MAHWPFFLSVTAISYGALSGAIRYVYHWRRGARILAAQAAVQAVICTGGLGMICAIYRTYFSG
jgi:hypothetical protein